MYTYISIILVITISIVSGTQEHTTFDINHHSLTIETNGTGLSICQECIKESVAAINVLLNLILDQGIIGNCGDLCGALTNKTNSTAEGDVCLVVCNVMGIAEFIKVLEHTDLDPIWYCQMAKLCPSKRKSLGFFLNRIIKNKLFSQ